MSEYIALGMVCTCGDRAETVGDPIKAAHPDWDIETAFYYLNDIGGTITVVSDQWFRIAIREVRWVADDKSREFSISVECDRLLIGAIHLYDKLAEMWKDWTGEAYGEASDL